MDVETDRQAVMEWLTETRPRVVRSTTTLGSSPDGPEIS